MPKPKPPIEPKPTRYGGVTFRSRLEARWAVFFDFCPNVLNWKYEPPAFHNSGNQGYTPDFRLEIFGWSSTKPRQDTIYVEIKPAMISPEYKKFLKRMVKENNFILFVIMGDFFALEFFSFVLNPKGKQVALALDDVFKGIGKAARLASHYRFDLKE